MTALTYRIMVIINVIMAILFLFATGVQYNDPDGIEWMLIYLGAAGACILYAWGKYQRFLAVLVLVAALVWAGFIFPDFFEGESFSFSTFSSVRMTNMEFETAREFGGLMIISLWMAIIALFPPSSGD